MRKLAHPKFVHFVNWFQTESRLLIILEFLDRDLSLPETVIKIFGYDIIGALLYLHKNPILMNDLTSRNIFVDEYGVLKAGGFSKAAKFGAPLDLSNVDVELFSYSAP